jgi:isoquinoline 1-oxidoreductase beta subunit
MKKTGITRRDLLKLGAAAGGGLVLGFSLGGAQVAAAPATPTDEQTPPEPIEFTPNAWLTIGSDDRITLRVGSSEMGQGTLTGIAMLIADELDADWSRVTAEHAPVDTAYTNPILRRQATGGSTAIRGFWSIVRKAGAAGRELMLQAAALQWGVSAGECRAHDGEVVHEASGRRRRYGALADAAAALPVPDEVFLKDPDEFILIGRSVPRLDTPAKVDGTAVYGIDVRLPGLLTATVARSPVLGGRVKRFDASQALAVPGVKRVAQVSAGVAVIAEHFWAAKQGRDALVTVQSPSSNPLFRNGRGLGRGVKKGGGTERLHALAIQWDDAVNQDLDSTAIEAQFRAALEAGGVTERDDGDLDGALAAASGALEAVYRVPYQAHACMEPMNATADVRPDGCDIYAPTQGQSATQETAMGLTGLPRERVKVHTTFLGGGFGRRSEQDFIRDALECSMAVGAPVKVIWTREDDIRHGQYRPATYNRLRGGVDGQGRIVAWEHRIAGPSIMARVRPASARDGRDWSSTEGAKNLPYDIANLRVSYAMANTPVPVGFWRSVGSSQNAYITECFFDELARRAGRDPVEARLELLGAHPRHAGVVRLAADKAGWGQALPEGRARGIAVAESFASFVAQVAEVSVDRGRVRVHRVTCAVDCGRVVNPDSVRAQMEGAIVYGLTAALKGAITIGGGQVRQSNFDDYPLLALNECPAIDVHIVPSTELPGGVGEPGVPPAAPAVANALLALTGKPVRSLPVRLDA